MTDEKILNLLLSENVSEEAVIAYVNNETVRYNVDYLLIEKLQKDFNSGNFDLESCLNFLENAIDKLIEDKPYLVELNIINRFILQYKSALEKRLRLENMSTKSQRLLERLKKLTMLQLQIEANYISLRKTNTSKEKELVNKYLNKINNNEELTEGEVTELACLYITCELAHSDNVLNYIYKMLIEKEYKIDKFLYRRIFEDKCESLIKEKGLGNIKININENTLNSNECIMNFIDFFRRIRCYEQINVDDISINSLMCAKNEMLKKFLGEEYSEQVFDGLPYEKDAMYCSLQDTLSLLRELSSSKYEECKETIGTQLNVKSKRMLSVGDFELLFEEQMALNRDALKNLIYSGNIPVQLLIEYKIDGTKRNLFELFKLKEEELEKEKPNPSVLEAIEYLLYNETVSLYYLEENNGLLRLKKDSKYYEQVKSIVDSRLDMYGLIQTDNKLGYSDDDISASM